MKYTRPMSIALVVVFSIFSLVFVQILWAQTATDLTQFIDEGTLSVDIVDADGASVTSPSVAFSGQTFSFDAQDSTGTLGIASQKIRLSNPTATPAWSVSIAATGGTWTDGTNTYPYNAATADAGRLTVNPATGSITGVNGCATTNVTTGSQDFFLDATTTSITLMSASAEAAIGCRWDLTGVSLTQRIPAAQAPGNYTIGMTITAT